MTQADNAPSTPQPLRALTMFDHVPAGCILRPVTDDDSAPHLRAGEFAVIDTTDTDPQHGEVYLVRFNKRGQRPNEVEEVCYIQQVIAKRHSCGEEAFIGFWTHCLNFEPYRPGSETSRRSMADGPREADMIKKALVGRVIGFYSAPHQPPKLAAMKPNSN